MCCYSKEENVVLEGLRLLDTIICYNHVPPQSLPLFIATLCHTANSQNYCVPSWRVNKKYLVDYNIYNIFLLIYIFSFMFRLCGSFLEHIWVIQQYI